MITGSVFVTLFLWVSAAGANFSKVVVTGAGLYIAAVIFADYITRVGV